MRDSFGARLRERREQRGIDLTTIARQTKIKASLLEALERDDVSQWPGGFYRRAFIREYAQAIDLDPEAVLREFQEVHPEPEIDLVAAMASALGVHGAGPISRVRSVADLAIGSLARLRRGSSPADTALPTEAPVTTTPTSDLPPPADVPPTLSDRRPVLPPAGEQADLAAVADLCTAFVQAATDSDLQRLLRDFAALVGAGGLIVWLWDAFAEELKPVLVHGYSDQVIALLPPVRGDADNATAMAFRSARTCAVAGNDQMKGALVVPLLTRAGCTGVLAIELQPGQEPAPTVRAIATILATLLSTMTIAIAPPQVHTPREPASNE